MLAQGQDVVPIPGTKRPHYLEKNLGALDVRLTDDDRSQLDGMVAMGGRYPQNSV